MAEAGLSQREKLFCHYLARLGNAREAAIWAGFTPLLAEMRAASLLSREDIRAELESQIDKQKQTRENGEAGLRGLERLAFGSINDAARLASQPGGLDAEELARLDLFPVSEIKQPKGGGCEIKFFDRLKAMELLLKYSHSRQDRPGSFYEALERAAQSVSESDEV